MTEKTLYYKPPLLKRWTRGKLHPVWYGSYREGYCDLDHKNADRQCKYRFGFAECVATRHFRRHGYEVLTSKYLHPNRPEKREKAKQILGKGGVDFLVRRRRFGNAKLRKSPYPDLLVFKPNLKEFFFAEVKRDSDRLSKEQRLFFAMMREHGYDVRIVNVLKKAERSERRQPRSRFVHNS